MFNYIFRVLFLMTICSQGMAQSHFFKRYGTEDGLPVSEVFGTYYSHDSILYVTCLRNGVYTFDGYEFSKVDIPNIPDYLPRKVYDLEDNEGTFLRDRDSYFRLKNDSCIILKGFGKRFNYSTYGNYFFHEDSIFLFNKDSNIMVFDRFIDPQLRDVLNSKKWKSRYFWLSENKEKQLLRLDENYYLLNNGQIQIIILEELTQRYKGILPKDSSNEELPSILEHLFLKNNGFAILPESNFLSAGKVLFQLDHDTLRQVCNYAENYEIINDHEFMAGGQHGLFHHYTNIIFFDGLKDNIGLALHTIAEDNKGNIWFGDYHHGFTVWDGDVFSKPSRMPDHKVLPGSIWNGDRYWYFSDQLGKGLCTYTEKDGEEVLEFQDKPFSGYIVRPLKNGKIAASSKKNGVVLITESEDGIFQVENTLNKHETSSFNILGLEEDHLGRIWGTGKGIRLYFPQEDTSLVWDKSSSTLYTTISLVEDNRGTMWMGGMSGLKYLKNCNKLTIDDPSHMENIKHLSFPNNNNGPVHSVEIVDDYVVWGNNSTLFFLELESFYENEREPIIYSLLYGEDISGKGTEQNCILFDSKRRLWIGHNNGATMIYWDQFPFDTTKINIHLSSFECAGNRIKMPLDRKIRLEKNKRSFNVHYRLEPNYSLRKNVYFDQFLVRNKLDTIYAKLCTQERKLDIPYIDPGKYQFHLIAKKHNQVVDKETIYINVPKNLSEITWFWLFLSLLFFSLIGYFVFLQLQKSKQIRDKEYRLNQANLNKDRAILQSIISSFNPHFINNSLHWIQSRYSDDPEMVTVTGRLSNNIVSLLKNSQAGKAYHSFSEELTLVDNYIQIQQIRFKDRFTYIPPDMNASKKWANLNVPIMQIQIHVENAIEHGINNRLDSTYVKVVLQELKEYLQITVEDDGVGRDTAGKMESKGTSLGIDMLKKMHEILNQNNVLEITQKYEDNIFGNFGTRVIIKVPLNYTYDL